MAETSSMLRAMVAQASQNLLTEDIGHQYYVINELGQGTFGKVLLAQHRDTGKSVALKLVRKDKTKLGAFLLEVCTSICLSNHPGIITTYSSSIDTAEYYIFTQELATAGGLDSIIQPKVGIPEAMVKRCALQLAGALEYMHSRGFVHRDLKPDNVLLMDKECHHIKLSDFGLTQLVGTLVPPMSHIIPYMSPELCALRPNQHLALESSIDTWAFGILLFTALTGYFPWEEALEHNQRYQVFVDWQSSEGRSSPPLYWKKFTRGARDMFHRMLSQIPSYRSPVVVVLDYLDLPWNARDLCVDSVEVIEDAEEDFNVVLIEEREDFEFIIIQETEEMNLIVVESRGDVEFFVGNDSTEDSEISSPVIVFLMEDTPLSLASEVEIT